MPKHKEVIRLYDLSIKQMQNILIVLCSNLCPGCYTSGECQGDGQSLCSSHSPEMYHRYLIERLPGSVLDDLMYYFSTQHFGTVPTLTAAAIIKLLLYPSMKRLVIKNLRMESTYWETIGQSNFTNLVHLNLALTCTDHILKVIGKYCANLEYLNATSRYKQIRLGFNATSFLTPVSDQGLRHLYNCQRLRILIINEPRSLSKSMNATITSNGLRDLIENIPSLEDISYADLGKLIATEFGNGQQLNLKSVRHFNATPQSIRTILGACPRLENLFLQFFGSSQGSEDIVLELINSGVKLKCFESFELKFGRNFEAFFSTLGQNLHSLLIADGALSYESLEVIGKFCPNLKLLTSVFECNQFENIPQRSFDSGHLMPSRRIRNYGQFKYLEELHILGEEGINIEKILMFSTMNSRDLKILRLMRQEKSTRYSEFFTQWEPLFGLEQLEIVRGMVFKKHTLRRILDLYKNLQLLHITCDEDCTDIRQELIGYDIRFRCECTNGFYVLK